MPTSGGCRTMIAKLNVGPTGNILVLTGERYRMLISHRHRISHQHGIWDVIALGTRDNRSFRPCSATATATRALLPPYHFTFLLLRTS